jgi:hypothetical protein
MQASGVVAVRGPASKIVGGVIPQTAEKIKEEHRSED